MYPPGSLCPNLKEARQVGRAEVNRPIWPLLGSQLKHEHGSCAFPDPPWRLPDLQGWHEGLAPAHLVSPGVSVFMVGLGVRQRLGLLFQQLQRVQKIVQSCSGPGLAPGRAQRCQVFSGFTLGTDVPGERSARPEVAKGHPRYPWGWAKPLHPSLWASAANTWHMTEGAVLRGERL